MKCLIPSITLACFLIGAPVWAGPYEDGQRFYEQKKYDQALIAFTDAVRQQPTNAMAHYELGLTYRQLDRQESARASFEEALKLDSTLAERTKISEMMGKLVLKADNTASLRKKAQPKLDEAEALYSNKQYTEAAAAYEASIKLDPNNALAHYKLSLSYYQLKKEDEAVKAYEQALKIDPSLADYTKINQMKDQAATEEANKQADEASIHRTRAEDMVRVLRSAPLYIEESMRSRMTQNERTELTTKLRSIDPPVKAVILTEDFIRQESKRLAGFTTDLHSKLGLDDSILIVATEQGVAAVSSRLEPEETEQIVNNSLDGFSNGYAEGIVSLAHKLGDERGNRIFWATLFWTFVILGLLAAMFYFRRKRNLEVAHDRDDIKILLARYSEHLTTASDNVRSLLNDPKAKGGITLYNEAKNIYDKVTEDAPYTTDLKALHRMKASLYTGLDKLKEAKTLFKLRLESRETAKTGELESDTFQSDGDASRLPDVGRPNGCFFCSQPTNPKDGEIIILKDLTYQAKVLACSTCAKSHHRGQTPHVAGRMDGYNFTPWYEIPDYNYYRDSNSLNFLSAFALSSVFAQAAAMATAKPVTGNLDPNVATAASTPLSQEEPTPPEV